MTFSEDFDLAQPTGTYGYNTAQDSDQGNDTPIYERFKSQAGDDLLTPTSFNPLTPGVVVPSAAVIGNTTNGASRGGAGDDVETQQNHQTMGRSSELFPATAPVLRSTPVHGGRKSPANTSLPFHASPYTSVRECTPPVTGPAPGGAGQSAISAPIRCATESEIGRQNRHIRTPSDFEPPSSPSDPNKQNSETGWQSALAGNTAAIDEKMTSKDQAFHEDENASESDKSVTTDAKRRKCYHWIISALSFLVLALLGAVIYVAIRDHDRSNSTEASASNPLSSSNPVSNVFTPVLDPVEMGSPREHIYANDTEVQQYLNNPELRKSFYGISYSPRNARYPMCNTTQREVTLDMAVLSQLTSRVRLYGTDCNAASYVLNAIEDLGLDMTISLGIWITGSPDVSLRQIDVAREVLTKYPSRYFNSVLLGNEALFRREVEEHQLVGYIDYFKDFMRSRNLTHIPIGTSEIGSLWTNSLAKHVDILAANIHPFFGGVPVKESTKWTYDFLFRHVVESVSPYDGQLMISEVGWPSGGGNFQGAKAGLDELQTFLDTWLCTNKDSDVGWYWFEAYDASWKAQWNTPQSEWETQWGLLTDDRSLKDIVLPDCLDS